MRHKAVRFCLIFVFASSALAQQQNVADKNAPDAARLRAHVSYLASDELEGRRTGTPGAEKAAAYIAATFMSYGLMPGGGARVAGFDPSTGRGDYRAPFPYVAAVELGKQNAMTFTSRAPETSPQSPPATLDLRVGEDWMPLGFSASGSTGKLTPAFAGYGIAAAELNYDDYKKTDVSGRAAIAFAGTPDGDNPHGQFVRYGDLRLRAAAARAAGAKALVLVATDENFKEDRLARLAFDNAGGDARLPVVVVSRQAAAQLLGLSSVAALGEFEQTLRKAITDAQGAGKGGAAAAVKTDLTGALLSVSTDIVRREAPASNVIGILYGSDPQLRNEAIVIGAHYDHLGRGGQGSLAAREGEIHHGADDNASGTACLLELARLLSRERKSLRRTIVFVAFAGEEEGLLGSNHYVNHPAFQLEQTIAMINMDMVGRLKDRVLTIGGVGTAAEWKRWIEAANNHLDIRIVAGQKSSARASDASAPTSSVRVMTQTANGNKRTQTVNVDKSMPVVRGADGSTVAVGTPAEYFALRLNEDGYGPSDHASFYAKRIPVLFFFTGTHEDYHKPSDTAERVNYEGAAQILDFVRSLVSALQESDKRPTFAVAKSEGAGRSTGFRVYLGTIPNYGETNDGLRLDGVREGSPAEKAGLKAGDRIVRMAGRDVRNVYDYTNALSGMKAGEEYEVGIVRDGQPLTLRITPAARK
ncbi:MAG TPA: M20/M25/M40 family metallo-hydrolase [Pyrinomonadaceae bacterium]|nr:M20/M25/M40 family metallo-hydrolase [Pyrinomonadaceae bacterium]